MPLVPVYQAQVVDEATGRLLDALKGQPVQIVLRGTTTPAPIFHFATEDPIANSMLTVNDNWSLPEHKVETGGDAANLYLDWLDPASGARGPVRFEEALRAEMRAARERIEAVADRIESAPSGGVNDEGIGELIVNSMSATALALAARYGPGFIVLELGEPRPADLPPGTVIIRTGAGSGGTPVVPTYVSDLFERTVASGWGTADTGGPWTTSSTNKTSVSGGAARAQTVASEIQGGILQGFSQLDTETHLVTSLGNTAGARLVRVQTRRTGSSTFQQYAVRQYGASHATSPGRVDVSIDDGATYVTGVLTGVAADQKFHIKVRVTGVSPTLVQIKVWLDGTPEPATWSASGNVATGPQVAGYGGIYFYSTSSEPGTAQHALHEFEIKGV